MAKLSGALIAALEVYVSEDDEGMPIANRLSLISDRIQEDLASAPRWVEKDGEWLFERSGIGAVVRSSGDGSYEVEVHGELLLETQDDLSNPEVEHFHSLNEAKVMAEKEIDNLIHP